MTVQPTTHLLYWLSNTHHSCSIDCPAHSNIAIISVQPSKQSPYWLSEPQPSWCTKCPAHSNIIIMTVQTKNSCRTDCITHNTFAVLTAQPTTQLLYWLTNQQHNWSIDCPAHSNITIMSVQSKKHSYCTDCPAHTNIVIMTVQPTTQSLYWPSNPQNSCCTVQPTATFLWW